MRNKRRRVLSSALRGVIAISSGTLVGQLIIAVATPFLSRIYAPEAFGAFSAVLALASAVGPAAALKFDAAVLLPSRDEDARGLLLLALSSVAVVSLLTTVAMTVVGPWLFADSWPRIPFAAVWVGLLVLTTGVFSCLVQSVLRAKSYSLVGWRATIQSLGINASQIAIGLFSPAPMGLAIGTVFGRALGFGALIKGALPLLRSRGGATCHELARKYWRSPLILAPSSLLNALGTQLPLVLITAIFGSAAGGQMTMAQRLVFLPAALVGAALAQVFGAEIAERLRNGVGGSRALYLRATLRIAGAATLMCAGILLLAPLLLPLVLGGEWEQSGYIAQAMALSASFGLIVSPLSQVYLVHQSAASLAVDGSRVALIGAAALVVHLAALDVVAATWALYSGQVLNYWVTWAYGLRIVSREGN